MTEVTGMDREGSMVSEQLVEPVETMDEDVDERANEQEAKLIYHPFQNPYSTEPLIQQTMKSEFLISVYITSKQ